jgi:alpha-N-arabinofuranosidase
MRVVVEADQRIASINPNVYGHFAEHLGGCIYDGVWVGPDSPIENTNGIRSDVVKALRGINPPVVRWPGGAFADDYHWADGIGPIEQRPRQVNAHWGRVIEDNQFGTHEFMEFCSQIGAEPYVCGNLGSGSVREMRDWLEYMNFDGDSTLARLRAENGHPEPFGVKYFGIGNENWGCGGNMSPEYYAHEVRRYSTFLFFGSEPFHRIACGPCSDDPEWTRRFFEVLAGRQGGVPRLDCIDGFALHYYCGTAGTATEYDQDQWYELLHKSMWVEAILVKHRAIMDGFDPTRRIGLIIDEWGTWHPVMEGTNPSFLKQQNTIRDALVAALSLDTFNRHADKVTMANIAQTVNVLQSMVLTEGPKMMVTPTCHVYGMYAPHQGADSLRCRVDTDEIDFMIGESKASVPRVAGSCSRNGTSITLSLVNTHVCEPVEIEVDLRGVGEVELRSWRVLTAKDIHDHNSFDDPDRVSPTDGDVCAGSVALPPASVNVLQFCLNR